MKKIVCLILLMCICVLGIIPVQINADSNEVYPGTPIVTFESITGNELIESKTEGDKTTYVYPYVDMDNEDWQERYYLNYTTELSKRKGWSKVSEEISGQEHLYTYNGYLVQINVDVNNEKVYVTVYEDKEGKYEIIDNSVITVYVNGKRLYFDVEPQLINGRTMVPMRTIFEALNSDVKWDDNTKKITALKVYNEYATNIEMQINSKTMRVNDEIVELDVAPVVIEGRTLVPVRAISEALRVTVEWHGPIKAVDIYATKPNTTVLYNEKDDTVNSPNHLLKKYKKFGWTTTRQIKYVTMYAEDGRTATFKESEVDAQKTVGWYTEPVQRLYAIGKSQVFKKSEVAAQLKVGWYEEPVVYVYLGANSMIVTESNVEKVAKTGWSTEKKEIGYVPKLSDFINTSTVIAKLYGTSAFIHNKSKYPLRIDGIMIDDYSHMYGSQKKFEVVIAPGEARTLHFTCYRQGCEELIHGSMSQARLSVEVVRNEGVDYGGFLYFDINGIFDIF